MLTAHNSLASVATLATRGVKLEGRTLRFKTSLEVTPSDVANQLADIARDGASVRVLEQDSIFTLRADGQTVVWDHQVARRERELVTIEVTL